MHVVRNKRRGFVVYPILTEKLMSVFFEEFEVSIMGNVN